MSIPRFSTTTHGITVTVETFYQKDYSNPMEHEFMFCYRVTIENGTGKTLKLLSRYWDIFDSGGFEKDKVSPEAGFYELGQNYGNWAGIKILDTPDVFHRYVEGEGVVGQNPVIAPGEQYEYVSGANIHEEVGQMSGYYIFEDVVSHSQIKAFIPSFDLITPMKLN